MLLSLLTFIALLTGIITVSSSFSKRKSLTQSALPRCSFSLWSLVLFLVFPPTETLSASRLILDGGQRNNYDEIF